eukprot:6206360-Pleurochrysis_carterae.AAC.2
MDESDSVLAAVGGGGGGGGSDGGDSNGGCASGGGGGCTVASVLCPVSSRRCLASLSPRSRTDSRLRNIMQRITLKMDLL